MYLKSPISGEDNNKCILIFFFSLFDIHKDTEKHHGTLVFYNAFSNLIRFLSKIRASITQYDEPGCDKFFFLILMFII